MVDDVSLNCTNRTTHNDTVFELECDHHLPTGHHNTTINFRFAPNIMPGNYSFDFEILHYIPKKTPTPQHHSSGSSGSSRTATIPNTKICTFKVVSDWIEPPPLVKSTLPDDTETDDIGNITIVDNVSYELDGEIITPSTPNGEDNIMMIVFGGIVCGILMTRMWYKMRKRQDEERKAE